MNTGGVEQCTLIWFGILPIKKRSHEMTIFLKSTTTTTIKSICTLSRSANGF